MILTIAVISFIILTVGCLFFVINEEGKLSVCCILMMLLVSCILLRLYDAESIATNASNENIELKETLVTFLEEYDKVNNTAFAIELKNSNISVLYNKEVLNISEISEDIVKYKNNINIINEFNKKYPPESKWHWWWEFETLPDPLPLNT